VPTEESLRRDNNLINNSMLPIHQGEKWSFVSRWRRAVMPFLLRTTKAETAGYVTM
jgi:hypothetical protein